LGLPAGAGLLVSARCAEGGATDVAAIVEVGLAFGKLAGGETSTLEAVSDGVGAVTDAGAAIVVEGAALSPRRPSAFMKATPPTTKAMPTDANTIATRRDRAPCATGTSAASSDAGSASRTIARAAIRSVGSVRLESLAPGVLEGRSLSLVRESNTFAGAGVGVE
jgi:hypothetical protein